MTCTFTLPKITTINELQIFRHFSPSEHKIRTARHAFAF